MAYGGDAREEGWRERLAHERREVDTFEDLRAQDVAHAAAAAAQPLDGIAGEKVEHELARLGLEPRREGDGAFGRRDVSANLHLVDDFAVVRVRREPTEHLIDLVRVRVRIRARARVRVGVRVRVRVGVGVRVRVRVRIKVGVGVRSPICS